MKYSYQRLRTTGNDINDVRIRKCGRTNDESVTYWGRIVVGCETSSNLKKPLDILIVPTFHLHI